MYSAKEFGMNLRKARKKKGYSQEQLAEAAMLSRDSIGKYERGEVHIGHEHVMKFCEILEVKPDYFYYGEQEEEQDYESGCFDILFELENSSPKVKKITYEFIMLLKDGIMKE